MLSRGLVGHGTVCRHQAQWDCDQAQISVEEKEWL